MSVTLGGTTVHGVNCGNDTTSELAVELACTIVEHGYDDAYDHAIVDRQDGLAIFRGPLDKFTFYNGNYSLRGWHFNAAVCGFNGDGPRAAAEILELFGFGDRVSIFDEIRHGEGDAQYWLAKATDTTPLSITPIQRNAMVCVWTQ